MGESPEKEPVLAGDLDDLLDSIKGTKRYQRLVVSFVLLPPAFACSFISACWLFVIATPPTFWCNIPQLNQSVLHDEHWRTALLPPAKDGSGPSKCEVYALNYTDILEEPSHILTPETVLSHLDATNHTSPVQACDSWTFDKSVYQDTIVTDWDLVCDHDYMPTLVYILGSIGAMFGTTLGGYLADRFGRKLSYQVYLGCLLIFGLCTTLAPKTGDVRGFWIFASLVLPHFAFIYPSYLVSSTLGLEIITADFRATFYALLTVVYSMGAVSFTLVAYLFRSWRTMVLATMLPFTTFGLCWFVMPESPRWLLSSESRFPALRSFLLRMASVNGVEWTKLHETAFQNILENKRDTIEEGNKNQRQVSYWDLFRRPTIRGRVLLLIIMAVTIQMVYYGLNFFAPILGGTNPYLSFCLSNLMELPAALFVKLACDRLGRRLMLMICFICGGISCLSTLALPVDAPFAALLILFLVAKLFVTAAYTVEELLVNELLPTVIRAEGVALVSFIGSIGANVGPITIYASNAPNMEYFCLVIFGAIMIFASVCTLFLPETTNRALPETFEDCEKDETFRWRSLRISRSKVRANTAL